MAAFGSLLVRAELAVGQSPPVLRSCFPAGCKAGQSVDLTLSGDNLQSLKALESSIPGVECVLLDSTRCQLMIPHDAPLGQCDIWAVSDGGISAPCTLIIGNRDECAEVEPNDSETLAQSVPLSTVVNGRIEKANDADYFSVTATSGQRVLIECQAERIDSTLRAVLEVFDVTGKRLAVNRGYFGTDPLIDFRVPADGAYIVRVRDLIAAGSAESIYRLAIDCGPRVAFARPNVVQRGTASRVTLYGWNLNSGGGETDGDALDSVEVDLPPALASPTWPMSNRLLSTQAVMAGHAIAYRFPGSHAPIVIGIADVPVISDRRDNHAAGAAQELTVPCEVSGQLVAGDEQDWFEFEARRGEVLHIEALGQRIESPVDLQISVLDSSNSTEPLELAQFRDEVRNIGGAFRTDHLDPIGRWVCPADGRYFIVIRNVIGGMHPDPRRMYRLSVRREEHDVQIVAVPHQSASAGINIPQNGRVVLDLFAMRQRGLDGSIRVSASNLPAGVEFPDVWFGPGVCRTIGVLSADRNTTRVISELKLEAFSDVSPGESRPVIAGITTPSAIPYAPGRLTSQMRMAVAGKASIHVTADAHQTVDHHLYGTLQAHHSPGGIVDVAIQIDRRGAAHEAPVKLIGIGLPDSMVNQTTTIPGGRSTGYLSYYLPPTISVGKYSFAIKAETTVLTADNKAESVIVFSNPVTIDVQPAAFLVAVDPFAVTQAKRGEVFQIAYNVRRLNGFIGKMHTELACPGIITDVPGLRGRGVTFVGQTDQGSLQIEVNGDAHLGQQQFLRLFAVGVVEDEPVFQGSHFLTLEITD